MSKSLDVKNEVIKYWKQSPVWARITWLFTVMTSASSIVSLSDYVFKWKGFILDGIHFYRSIVSPLKYLLSYLYKGEITSSKLDLIVLFGLFYASYVKITFIKQVAARKHAWIKKRKLSSLYLRAILGGLLFWVAGVCLVAEGILIKTDIFITILLSAFYVFPFIYPFYALQIKYLHASFDDSFVGQTIKSEIMREYAADKIKLFLDYYLPIATAILITFMLAAINNGLTKK